MRLASFVLLLGMLFGNAVSAQESEVERLRAFITDSTFTLNSKTSTYGSRTVQPVFCLDYKIVFSKSETIMECKGLRASVAKFDLGSEPGGRVIIYFMSEDQTSRYFISINTSGRLVIQEMQAGVDHRINRWFYDKKE